MTGRVATALAGGVAPLRDRRFRRLLMAMAVSALGNSGTLIALAWLVVVELDGGAQFSLILAGYTVPQFVVGLIGGALADRYGTRALSQASYVASGLTLLAMWLLGRADALGVGALAGLVVIAGAAVALAQPVTGAMMVSIVDERQLGPANMLRIIAIDTAVVLGPLAAGVVIAGFHAHTWFLLDSVTFLLAAVLLPRPRRSPSDPPAGPDVRQRLADVVTGMRFVAAHFRVWTGMAAAGLGNLLITVPMLVGLPTLVGSRGLSSGALGGLFASFTVGSILGAAEAGLVSRARPMLAALGFLLLAGVGVSLIGMRPERLMLFCLAVAIGFCIAEFDVRWSAFLQGAVPREIIGRALACDAWVSFVCRTVGLSTIGLVAVRQTDGLMIACGLVMATLAAVLAVSVRSRTGIDEGENHDRATAFD